MFTTRFITGFVFTLLLAALLLYLFDNPQGLLNEGQQARDDDTNVFAIAINASTRYFDEEGQLSYAVSSEKLEHIRSENSGSYTLVEKPQIEIFQEETPWFISAQKAKVTEDRTITLSKDVTLRAKRDEQHTTELFTQTLTFEPSEKMAHTPETVTISSPLGNMTATGMTANLRDRKIKLLDNVAGKHSPETIRQ